MLEEVYCRKDAKETITEFERRMSAEIRRQEKLDLAEEKDFRREELPERYTAKILYGWNNGKFKKEYLKKLKKNW